MSPDEIIDEFVEIVDESQESSRDALVEALTGQEKSKWRGGTKPGHPGKGHVTKKRYAQGLKENELLSEVDRQQRSDVADFHNAADPSVPILKEKPEHRLIAYMRARGMTNKEIFQELGGEWEDGHPVSGTGRISYVHLGNILKQPWFRNQVIRLQHEAGFSGVEAAIQAETPSALETVVEIMNDTQASATARLNAANSLLDRSLGKAIQRVESNNVSVTTNVLSDSKELDRKMQEIEQNLKQLGAG